MSAKEDVFVEHELRSKLFDLLAEFRKDIEHLAGQYGRRLWPPVPVQWEELQAVKVLTGDYVDDMIKEMNDVK